MIKETRLRVVYEKVEHDGEIIERHELSREMSRFNSTLDGDERIGSLFAELIATIAGGRNYSLSYLVAQLLRDLSIEGSCGDFISVAGDVGEAFKEWDAEGRFGDHYWLANNVPDEQGPAGSTDPEADPKHGIETE